MKQQAIIKLKWTLKYAADETNSWLPKMPVVISSLKRLLLETFHGISHQYMQDNADTFVDLFNHRWWTAEFCTTSASRHRHQTDEPYPELSIDAYQINTNCVDLSVLSVA